MGLKAPRRFDRVLHRAVIPGSEIGDDHHVLGESGRHREDVWVLVKQCVTDAERHPHHHVRPIQLAGNQSAVVLPPGEAAGRRASDT
jgi:hypothetical protein